MAENSHMTIHDEQSSVLLPIKQPPEAVRLLNHKKQCRPRSPCERGASAMRWSCAPWLG